MRRTGNKEVGSIALAVVLWSVVQASAALVPALTDFEPLPFESVTNLSTSPPGQDVAALLGDGFVLVWSHDETPANGADAFARFYTAAETPAGAAFLVNTHVQGEQDEIAVDSDAAGNFVVVWRSFSSQGNGDGEVYARLFDDTGTPLTAEIAVNESTTGGQSGPDIVFLADGSFVVAWEDLSNILMARHFSPAGAALGSQFQLNSTVVATRSNPSLAALAGGGFVAVWDDGACGSGCREATARVFDAAMTPETADLTASTDPYPAVSFPRALALPDGRFVIGWRDLVRVYAADGTPAGLPAQVEASDLGLALGLRAMLVRADGDLVVAFSSQHSADFEVVATHSQIFLRTFDIDTMLPTSDTIVVSRRLSASHFLARAARLSSGSFVIFYEGRQPPGVFPDFHGLRARRICDTTADPSCELCAGSDNGSDSDADSRPDDCDPCENAGDHDLARTKTALSNPVLVFDDLKPHKLNFRGRFTLPAGESVPTAIDPLARGARILIEDAAGNVLVDVTLPPGAYAGMGTAGWRASSNGRQWSFVDTTGTPDDGITKAKVSASADDPDVVRVSVRGFNGEYPIAPYFVPLGAVFVAGDWQDGRDGRCGEVRYQADDCSNDLRRIGCRR